ncbi:hypothetical protein [Nocardia sp. XZ_19_231]|uniref:hypothetical protein n=1 Tax=Nocardia sp. XZ_19_231 TaxID=2769252 RepID=UPI00188F9684|nr:hypothetical protein [Nocardia sp. XZ_19_231]
MGRQTDDGQHEGYVAHEFADGRSGGAWSAGPIADTGADGIMLAVAEWQTRGDAEVVGWRPVCSRDGRECWGGELWTRVADPSDHAPELRRIYSEAADLDEDVQDVLMQEWEAHIAPTRGTAEVRYLADEADDVQSRLAAAVRSAREQGASWEAIGKAARMTRQSAHERWSRVIG